MTNIERSITNVLVHERKKSPVDTVVWYVFKNSDSTAVA